MVEAGMDKRNTCLDYLIMGGIIVIGLAETAHLATIIFGWTFTRCVMLFCGLMGVGILLLCPAFIFYRKRKKEKTAEGHEGVHQDEGVHQEPHRFAVHDFIGTAEGLLFVFCAVTMLSQIIYIYTGSTAYRQGDMTVETVGSFLASNGIYQVNPITGSPYAEGIPSRLKILCLPTLYGSLCKITGLSPRTVVWRIVPVVILIAGYLSFASLGYCLFREERTLTADKLSRNLPFGNLLSGNGSPGSAGRHLNGKKLGCFMVAVSLLLWAGTYRYGVDGFDLLYCGYRGVVIRNMVLVPWLFSLCLRKKWFCTVLCILAEACITWTFYGMGVCLFITVGMAAIQFFNGMLSAKKFPWYQGKTSRAARKKDIF